jgi:4-amino-4-deoxy-L-arabinose transferase-like glycosyltransferase
VIVSACVVPAIIIVDALSMTGLSRQLNVWVDEAYTLHTASSGFAYALHQAVYWELQPPVYFLLITAIRHVSTSIFAARLFSIACVAAALWIAGLISKRLWPDQHPAWLVIVLAANPFVIGVAVEVRVYALAFLLSVALVYLFLEGYTGAGSTRSRGAFVGVAVIAVYTQYYLGFLLPAFALALLAMRRRAELFAYLRAMLIVGVCVVPILFVLHYQLSTNSVIVSGEPGLLAALTHEAKALTAGILAVEWTPPVARRVFALGLLLATIVLVMALRRRAEAPPPMAAFPFIVVAAAGGLLGIAVAATHQEITLRYATGLVLPAMLTVYGAFALIPPRPRSIVLAAWTVLILAASAGAFASEYKEMAKNGDWVRVASYIERYEQPGEPIVVFDAQSSLPLQLYYRGPNRITPLPRPVDFQRYDLRESALRSTRDVSDVFERAGSAGGSFWLVTTTTCRREPINFRCELLEEYVQRHFAVRRDEGFFLSRVRLLQRHKHT